MSERTIICYVCGHPVETYKVEIDYHKGAQYYGFKTIYPHEEKKIEFPEGRKSGIHVCQDCLGKPDAMRKLIKLARMNAVKHRIEQSQRQDKNDKNLLIAVKKRRKENKEKTESLNKYLSDLEKDCEPKHDWEALKIDTT